MEIEIKKLKAGDIEQFLDLIRLFERVFEMKDFKMPDHGHLRAVLADEKRFHVFVALRDDLIVGGLTVYTMQQYYSTRPLAYIFDLAVSQHLQRQGIGNKLIQHTRTYFAANGYEEVFVQADRVDDYALDFYRKTGPTLEEDVIHFTYGF
ncbi:MAG TPA: GNAT family N-acetyltransferase [Flavisolibacter sp.]|nr:GNAT family N-acetyltransferase [Flavisolibacter sp.]